MASKFASDDLLGFSFDTPEMDPKGGYTSWAEIARTKLPAADFREGVFEHLPVDDAAAFKGLP